jgi:hypothetical protein
MRFCSIRRGCSQHFDTGWGVFAASCLARSAWHNTQMLKTFQLVETNAIQDKLSHPYSNVIGLNESVAAETSG